MCSSLDYLSNMIANGSYEFISLTRCAFLVPSKDQYKKSVQSGGGTIGHDHQSHLQTSLEQRMDDYLAGFESNYDSHTKVSGKKSRKKKIRIYKKSSKKN